jgi:hypothetical protein
MWLNPETSNLAPKGTFEEEQTMLSVPPKKHMARGGEEPESSVEYEMKEP